MELLREMVITDGKVYDNNVLKVDSFLNHQIDTGLMMKMAESFYEYFKKEKITKILTIEASGIAPAIMVANLFKVPMVFAKKSKPSTLKNNDVYTAEVHSYTKNITNTIVVSEKFINKEDNVMIQYKYLRKRYDLYLRLAYLVITMLLIYLVSIRQLFQYRLYITVGYICTLYLVIRRIEKWYVKLLNKLLFFDLDIESWRQYIQINRNAKLKRARKVSNIYEIIYTYMQGDFRDVINKIVELKSTFKLSELENKSVAIYQVNSELLSNKINSIVDIEEILKDCNINDSDMMELTQRYEAILDIVIKKKSNDYFKEKVSEFRFDILESMYFDALNEQLKGNEQKAKELLTDISNENLDIFIVRNSKTILEEM